MEERTKPGGLAGLRVLALESRRAAEMAKLIANYGGGARASPPRLEAALRTRAATGPPGELADAPVGAGGRGF